MFGSSVLLSLLSSPSSSLLSSFAPPLRFLLSSTYPLPSSSSSFLSLFLSDQVDAFLNHDYPAACLHFKGYVLSKHAGLHPLGFEGFFQSTLLPVYRNTPNANKLVTPWGTKVIIREPSETAASVNVRLPFLLLVAPPPNPLLGSSLEGLRPPSWMRSRPAASKSATSSAPSSPSPTAAASTGRTRRAPPLSIPASLARALALVPISSTVPVVGRRLGPRRSSKPARGATRRATARPNARRRTGPSTSWSARRRAPPGGAKHQRLPALSAKSRSRRTNVLQD